ncbi:MAG: hypothetical protein H6700_06950 [Myxococcales bacterium]|nr:hypothetical protein [Myxococcales bacterium]MCB9531486.1 hypothetical protein [Myxococcales bacterium]
MSALPVAPPSDLTVPLDGSTATRSLVSAYLKFQLRTLLTTRYEVVTGDTSEAAAFRDWVGALARENPAPLFAALRRPTVGGLIRLIAVRDGDRAELAAWARELMAQLYFELALDGVDGGTVSWPNGTPPTLHLLSLGHNVGVHIPAGSLSLAFHGGRVDVRGRASQSVDVSDRAGLLRPFHALGGLPQLATLDNNPRAEMEAHPEKSGNSLDLGEKSADEWVGGLGGAFEIIDAHLPAMRPEFDLVLHQVVPVGYHAERHFSASLMEVIGNIYMTLHPDSLMLAEAIVHEFSHNKINMLWSMAPLLENAFEPLYKSPVRPDPRPLFGVLLAVHAFLPVEAMYFSLAASDHPIRQHPRFEERRRQIRAVNAEAAETVLTNGRPTEMGVSVLDEIRRVDAAHAAALA